MSRPASPRGLAAVIASARTASAGALRGRRLLGLCALSAVPVLIQLAILLWGRSRGEGFASFVRVVDTAYLRIIVPITLVFLGTAAFGDEWEGGTACYVVGTPVPRSMLVIGRWIVSFARGLILLAPSLVLVYVLAEMRDLRSGGMAMGANLPNLLWTLVGVGLVVFGYAAVFLLIGLVLRRSVMVSLIFVMFFEGFVSNLPHGFAVLSLSYHARNLLYRMTGALGFKPLELGNMHGHGEVLPTEPASSAMDSVTFIVVYTALMLALATWLLRRKEFTGGAGAEAQTASAG